MRRKLLIGLVALLLVAALVWAWFLDPAARLVGIVNGEPFFAGTSATGWVHRLSRGADNDRSAAVAALAAGKAEAVPVLLAALHAADPESRWRAADALGRIAAPDALSATDDLARGLDDVDPLVADVAAQSLGNFGPPAADRAVPALAQRFPRVECIRAVAKFGPAGAAADSALRPLLQHPDPIVRWNALRTIGKVRAISAKADVVRCLADENPEVREHAAEALGDFGPAAADTAADLLQLLADTAPRVRRDAVTAFGKFGPAAKPHLPAVQKLKDDANADVKAAAARAERLIDPSLAK
jgi:HEAT repeat protein